jgi:tripartite-type tricarboxylate transporter receptor subunit TctC
MRVITRRSVFTAAMAVAGPAGTRAQTPFPSRPVTLVVPYAAGGPTDVSSRVIAEQMRGPLRGQVLVDNRPGDSTILGARYVAAAPPDGHTLLMVPTTTLCTNPHIYARLPYKVEDFAPVGMAVKVPLGLAIRASLPVQTLAEFRDYVRARPGKLNYGSPGTGANSQLVNALANLSLGLDMMEVPYRGTAPALNDLAAGNVDALVDALATLAPLHEAGQIRIIGNFDDQRSPVVSAVPTFVESGYPDLVAFTWFAVVAPAATPREVIQILNAVVTTAVQSPVTQERFAQFGFVPQSSGVDELASYIRSEFDRRGPLIKRLGIRVE